ncbi:hypothetical protein EDB81DRAFT_843285 [Dactylonectria macrodidyma]|uniref:Cupin type-1 domain-containing protein n=1 Tax=Dactylonectria macrodidyma TaxID=307937 RepID=A0A9P9ER82_9HYPO|nr:hypothetical protein EDB81DRAFT_843285 [Dactylonectria macrodidyma]
MTELRQYHLFPTELIPNSPRPLLHYKNVLKKSPNSSSRDPVEVWRMFDKNEWKVSWIFRYRSTQYSHYHSKAHECMAVLSGTARIRFGVADTSDDLEESTDGSAYENGGVELEAEAGDIFIIPAGVAHKTYDTKPEAEFKLLTPGFGHGIEVERENMEKVLAGIQLDGFTMMGAYNGGEWDFIQSGGDFEKVWSVPKPKYDPVFGDAEQGLVRSWRGSNEAPRARL